MHIPFSEVIKSIPNFFGLHLDKEIPYVEIRKKGRIELRRYQPLTLARAESAGEFQQTIERNFECLASFVFGENRENRKVSMTTPVFHDETEDGWSMSFYIPEVGLHPRNTLIRIEEMPERVVAVLKFGGNNDIQKMKEAQEELLSAVRAARLTPTSKVWWAQYDQPFAIPLLKRNEAMVQVEFY